MDHIGIDVHKKESQICVLTAEGELREQRIKTRPESFREALGARPRAKVLIEACAVSAWVAEEIEGLGHDVIVGSPNHLPMYADRPRKVKTDRRDAQALAVACRKENYRAVHRRSREQRLVLARHAVRAKLVRTRASVAVTARSLLTAWNRDVRATPRSLPRHARELRGAQELTGAVTPLLVALESLSSQIRELDLEDRRRALADPICRKLMTVPGVGPQTALCFRAVIDDVGRFPTAAAVAAYLGLVPREKSSAEERLRLSITKTGHSRLRSLLVQSAWTVARSKDPAAEALRARWRAVASRRGCQKATVALARRLARLLYALWRDNATFEPPERPESAPAG